MQLSTEDIASSRVQEQSLWCEVRKAKPPEADEISAMETLKTFH